MISTCFVTTLLLSPPSQGCWRPLLCTDNTSSWWSSIWCRCWGWSSVVVSSIIVFCLSSTCLPYSAQQQQKQQQHWVLFLSHKYPLRFDQQEYEAPTDVYAIVEHYDCHVLTRFGYSYFDGSTKKAESSFRPLGVISLSPIDLECPQCLPSQYYCCRGCCCFLLLRCLLLRCMFRLNRFFAFWSVLLHLVSFRGQW